MSSLTIMREFLYFFLLELSLEIQDTLADDASGSSDDDYVDFEAEE